MNTYLAKVQVGNNASDLSPIASTMFGVCSSIATSSTKVVTFNKFDKLVHGVTIFVKFTYGNTLPGNLKLQVGSTAAYDILGDCICGSDEVIAFTFEELDGVRKYWHANSSGISSAMKQFILDTINTSTETPDVLIMKGSIGTGGNPGYLPSSNYETGWMYRVVSHWTYAGYECDEGDLLVAIANTGHDSDWAVIQGKLYDVVTCPTSTVSQHVAIFDDNTGLVIADGGYTIEKSVPSDAVFTDTTYSVLEGQGLVMNNNQISIHYGSAENTVTEGNDPRLSDYRHPLEHTHGNINDDGELSINNTTLARNVLLQTNAEGKIVAGPAFGAIDNDTSKYLNNMGQWSDIPVTSVNNQTGNVTLTLSDFNITGMRFIGQATVDIENGSIVDPRISSYNFETDKTSGDIILGRNDGREYIWTLDNEWLLLGQDATTTLDSDLLLVDANEDSNIWISQISQDSNRVISVKRGALDTSGTWTGNAATATKLLAAQKVYVNLESISTNTTIQGGSSDAEVLGITGVLNVAHGGTGTDSFNADEVIISAVSNNVTYLTSRAYTNNSSATALSSSSTNFITERSIYYGLPSINNVHNYDSSDSIYAPTSAGINGQILISNGNAPDWTEAAFIASEISDTTNVHALTTLTLGNNATILQGAHSEGQIILYSSNANSHTISGAADSTTATYTHILPNANGYIVQMPSLTAVGGPYNPIYISAAGVATALEYTPNRLYYSAAAVVGELISHQFLPSSHYASDTQISIGSTNAPDSNDTLLVSGASTLTGIVKITNTTDVSTGINGALYVAGGVSIAKKLSVIGVVDFANNLVVSGTTQLTDHVGIGTAPDTGTNSYQLYVNGTSYFNNAVDIAGITTITNNTVATSSTGALIVTGGIRSASNLYIDSTSSLLDAVAIGTEVSSNSAYILTIQGSTIIRSATAPIAYLNIDTTNTVESLFFYPHVTNLGQIGTTTYRWKSAVFSDQISLMSTTSSIILTTIDNGSDVGTITITATLPTISLASVGSNITNTWTLNNNANTLNLTNGTTLFEGNNDGFKITSATSSSSFQGVIIETDGTITSQNGTSTIIMDVNDVGVQANSLLDVTCGEATIQIKASGTDQGRISISAAIPTLLFDTTTAGITDWIMTNTQGVFSLNNQKVSIAEFVGTDLGFSIAPRLYINEPVPSSATGAYRLYINGGNTYSDGDIIPTDGSNLGSSTNRWGHIYVGSGDTYGDPYLPVYWNSGIPTNISGVVQYKEFEFSNTDTSVTLDSPAYNQLNGIHTYVIAVVVTAGEEYLHSPIGWSTAQVSGTTYGRVTLSVDTAVTGTVTGYILTARGCPAPNA